MKKRKQTPPPSLFTCLEELLDPREVRGRRHPFAAVLKLVMLGLICQQPNFTSIGTFATAHWKELQKALGFTRSSAPHFTTLERHVRGVTIEQIQRALHQWIIGIAQKKTLVASVDGKWIKQSTDNQGNPLILLSVFEQQLGLALHAYPMHKKLQEPAVFRAFLSDICEQYPHLSIFTFDALYAQRDLCSTLVEMGKHYLVRIKKNQAETYELIDRTFPKRKNILKRHSTLEKKRDASSEEPTIKTQS